MFTIDQAIDQLFEDNNKKCGGVRNDYFGAWYLQKEFDIPLEQALGQIAFGNNDYGVDGYHFDPQRRNLYLFQFKFSTSYGLFKDSFVRLIDEGVQFIFGASPQNSKANPIIGQIKGCLFENKSIIERVFFHFVNNGDPEEAEKSQVLDKLREDLENKKYYVDQYFADRKVDVVIAFRSSYKKAAVGHVKKTHTYALPISQTLKKTGPNGEQLILGFIPLSHLHSMHLDMGHRFFERNIRDSLGQDEAVNRSVLQAFKRIVLDGSEQSLVFPFNHNGVTLFAEDIRFEDGSCTITEPRLLNGAQTVSTFGAFLRQNEGNKVLEQNRDRFESIEVLAKVITKATPAFVTSVTINNNRQNPVEPWTLHANDLIQLQLQDKLRDDVQIYYERQENAFENLSDQDLEEQGIVEYKAIELKKLAQTLIAVNGTIDKLSKLRDVFEDDKVYSKVFNDKLIAGDSRKIVLCYKVQLRLRKLVNDIVEKGQNAYYYMPKARNLVWALVCQGLLNRPDIEQIADNYGKSLSVEANFTEIISLIATSRVRFIIKDFVEDKDNASKVEEEKFGFLRTNAAFTRCMQLAHKNYKWVQKSF